MKVISRILSLSRHALSPQQSFNVSKWAVNLPNHICDVRFYLLWVSNTLWFLFFIFFIFFGILFFILFFPQHYFYFFKLKKWFNYPPPPPLPSGIWFLKIKTIKNHTGQRFSLTSVLFMPLFIIPKCSMFFYLLLETFLCTYNQIKCILPLFHTVGNIYTLF